MSLDCQSNQDDHTRTTELKVLMKKFGITVNYYQSIKEKPNAHLANEAYYDPLAFLNYKRHVTEKRNRELIKELDAKV